jgi:dTDP-4-amino-4,6-dideoxygalactose transaminase
MEEISYNKKLELLERCANLVNDGYGDRGIEVVRSKGKHEYILRIKEEEKPVQKQIPVCEPNLSGLERKYLIETFDSGWISSISPRVKEFEEAFCEFNGSKYGISTTSGTTALHLAVAALDIGKGDEVIIPTFTMVATCNAVLYQGAKPVLVDSEPDTWCMDVEQVKEKITPKTKAIMPVHIYGHSCDMKPIMDLAEDHDLYVIEDCAEAIGTTYRRQRVGTIGTCGCFSFYANKTITCFPPGTKILIKPPRGGKGLSRMKKIENIKIGDEVLSFNINTSQKEFDRVIQVFERDFNGELLKIEFSNHNKISLTPNHPVFVVNKGWVPAEKLKVGDEVIQYKYRGLAWREIATGKSYGDEEKLKEKIKTFVYNPNIKIVKIVKIEREKYKGKVYNIETEKNHNYFAYGILVHNCGEGGIMVTNDDKLAEKARILMNHGFTPGTHFLHHYIGFNFRMTALQAAIGLAQLERVHEFIEIKRRNAMLDYIHPC